MNFDNLCINCMKEKSGPGGRCEHCGFDPSELSVPPHHLSPYVILAGKYLVGTAIGEGGFGITYIGLDLNLEMRVAIKEYYPNGCAVRDNSGDNTSVQSYTGEQQAFFDMGREKFINEAKTLAKCINLPGIVSVRDFFKENQTAYIVMEYVEGVTLKSYLKEHGGRLSVSQTLKMMQPVIESLEEVHKMNLIHRDISPDNIMIRPDGSIKVLDFGGARDFASAGGKSMSIMLKPGYAPEEQYRTHGEQGPWTDIYALCATMYRCITGEIPPESMERTYRDTMKPLSEFDIDCPPYVDYAIRKGLSVYSNGRYSSMQELYNALYLSGEQDFTEPVSQRRTGSRTGESVTGGHRSVPAQDTPSGGKKEASLDKLLKRAIIVLGIFIGVLLGVAAATMRGGSEPAVSSESEADSGKDKEADSKEDKEKSSDKENSDKKNSDKEKASDKEKSSDKEKTSDKEKNSDKDSKTAKKDKKKKNAEEQPKPAAIDKVDMVQVQHFLGSRGSNANQSLYIYDCQTGIGRGVSNCEQPYPASALISIPILYTTAKRIDNGTLALDTPVSFEYTYSGGRGTLSADKNGRNVSIDELLRNMLQYSDNNAINTLINVLSLEEINNTCRNAGFSSVDMQRKLIQGSSSLNNYISARDTAMLLDAIYKNTFQTINSDYLRKYMRIEDKAGRLGIFASEELYNGGLYCNQNGVIPDETAGRYTEAGIIFADGKEYIISTLADGGNAKVAASEFGDAAVYIHSCMKEG